MPAKKNKTRSKIKSKSRRLTGYPKALITIMVLLLVAGIVTVKYLQTPKGQVVLLDAGFFSYYAQVQARIGGALRAGLKEYDLETNVIEKAGRESIGGKTVRYLTWQIACGAEADLVLINLALTNAVHDVGGRVRQSEETDEGKRLLFVVGSGKYDTHRLELRKAAPAVKPDKTRPKLALVIDDMGYSRNGVVKELLALDLPLTVAILPGLVHSAYALEAANDAGKCAILHLPMEPEESQGSDVEEVKVDMSEAEIKRVVERYVRGLPGIKGANNHQGSRATADRRVMEAVLRVFDERGLFFLDSLTSNKSIAYNTARDLGVPAARNDAFIDDNTQDAEVVGERLRGLVAIAKTNGVAVGIGHPRRWTVEALKNNQEFLKNSGVELVFLAEVVE